MTITQIGDDQTYGTSLQGYLDTTYDWLVKIFGEPKGEGDGYKVDAQWCLNIDGKITIIYNYKNGKNYLGEEGTDTKKNRDWYIGGRDSRVVDAVRAAMTANDAPYSIKPYSF